MGLSVKKIIELSAKIYAVESNANILPMPDSPEERQKLIENKTIKNYKSFTPKEKQFMQENKDMFPQDQYPKMCEWLKDTSKLLGDEFKSAEPTIKANPEYTLLATLKVYTTLSGESQFFDEQNLKDLHSRLAQLIGKDDPNFFQKVNKLIEAMAASDAKQPIHDFFVKLNLPAANKKWDKEKWYDLAVKTSPRALLYLARADEIEAYLGGVPKTLEEAAKALGEIAYPGSKEKIAAMQNLPEGISQKDLAEYTAFCVGKGMSPVAYNKGLDILLGNVFEYEGKLTKIKAKTNIPSVAIAGKDIAEKYGDPELAKYRLEVLKPQDWRMLVMGELTNCCQSIGNHGAKCALEAMTNENCGVVAVFKGDKIVGQSFVWLGQDDEKDQKTFVFDSWERLSPDLDFLCAPFYNEVAGKLSVEHGINKVTIGTGGNTPKKTPFVSGATSVKYKDKPLPYGDSYKQYVISDIASGIDPKDNLQKIKDINNKIKLIAFFTAENKSNDKLWVQQYLKETIGKITDINIADYNGHTLLSLAALSGDIEVAELLIEKGADVNSATVGGNTPLHIAIGKGYTRLAELLIEKGADMAIKDENGNTPFGNLIRSDKIDAKLFIEKNCSMDVVYKNSGILLPLCVGEGKTEIVKLLIQKGADVNIPDTYGNIPLHQAVKNGNTELAKLFIEKGANANMADKYDRVPLKIAFDNGHIGLAKLLIEKGANFNVADKYGSTLPQWAVENGKIEAVKLLIEKGANVDETDKYGNPLLHLAVEKGKTEMVKLLIEKGANVSMTDKYGKTAADVAKTPEIKQLIEDHIKAKAEQKRLLATASTQSIDPALSSTAVASDVIKAKINSDQVKLPTVQTDRGRGVGS